VLFGGSDRRRQLRLPVAITSNSSETAAEDLSGAPRPDRTLWVSVAVLGLVTNVAYGVAYYSFGVLIDPINTSTGWSPAALGATFSAVLVIGGIGGLAGGRLVDRLGPRPAFLIAAALGSAGLAVASVPSGLLAFAIPYALGCGVISALGFYHITQPTAMRAAGDERDRAVVWLTILGAFASPIFLPLTAWLVRAIGWQGALRVDAGLTLVIFAAAALASPRRATETRRATLGHRRARDALAAAWRAPAFRRWITASMIAGAAIDIILVNQVPAMIAAGLSTGVAATIGGLRGLAQLGGRIPLTPVMRRLGTRATLIATFLVGSAGAAMLLFSGDVAVAILYSALAGASIGAVYTLQGIYTHELVGEADLALVMGAQQALFAIGGALGPALAGVILDITHSYTPILLLTTAGFLTAATTIATGARARPSAF
jgi:MFS family permease